MSIYKYYLKLPNLEALNAVLLNTLGRLTSSERFTIVPVSEPLTQIGGSEDEPVYAEPSSFVYANVYSPQPIDWPEVVESETPATPWSDLG